MSARRRSTPTWQTIPPRPPCRSWLWNPPACRPHGRTRQGLYRPSGYVRRLLELDWPEHHRPAHRLRPAVRTVRHRRHGHPQTRIPAARDPERERGHVPGPGRRDGSRNPAQGLQKRRGRAAGLRDEPAPQLRCPQAGERAQPPRAATGAGARIRAYHGTLSALPRPQSGEPPVLQSPQAASTPQPAFSPSGFRSPRSFLPYPSGLRSHPSALTYASTLRP